MSESVAALLVNNVSVTTTYREALLRQKYAPKVANHLAMGVETFRRIDWRSHSRAVSSINSASLRKILWNHHPTMCHMKITGQRPSNRCPICGEPDRKDHFLACEGLNKSREYKILRDEMRHKARADGMPDHMVNTTAHVLSGREIMTEDVPRHAREVYREQEEIGWTNYARGRLAERWAELRTTDAKGVLEIETKWRVKATKRILLWTSKKWALRCRKCATPEANHETRILLEQCRTWWEERDNKSLLQVDKHLVENKQEPKEWHSADYLRAWIRNRTLAEHAYMRYRPGRSQPTLHRWLVQRSSYRDGEGR